MVADPASAGSRNFCRRNRARDARGFPQSQQDLDAPGPDQVGQAAHARKAELAVERSAARSASARDVEPPLRAVNMSRAPVGDERAADPLPARLGAHRQQRDEAAEQDAVSTTMIASGARAPRPRHPDGARPRRARQLAAERVRPIAEAPPRLDADNPGRLRARQRRRGAREASRTPRRARGRGRGRERIELRRGPRRRARATPPAPASSSDSGDEAKPALAQPAQHRRQRLGVFQPRPLMWKMMIDPGRVAFEHGAGSAAGRALRSDRPRPRPRSPAAVPCCARHVSTRRFQSPNGGRKATLCLPKRASAASVSSISSPSRAAVSSGMCGWS